MFFWRSGRGKHGVLEAVEHLAHFDRTRQERFYLADSNHAIVAGHHQMVLELGGGVERDAYKPRELLSGFLARTFDDIRRDRHRRTDKLIAERGVIGTANSRCHTADTQRE